MSTSTPRVQCASGAAPGTAHSLRSFDCARAAFSMIELGLAVVFLSLMVVPSLNVLQTNVKGTAQSLQLTRAFQFARTVVDLSESFDYASLSDEAVKIMVDQLPVPEGLSAPKMDPVESITTPLANGARLEAKVVTVHVEYVKSEGSGARGEVTLHGLVARAR